MAGLDATWRGLSLTMPLKEAAFAVATTVTETARVTGAVNTLVRRRDGGWDAHNTDVRGIEAALADVEHDGDARPCSGAGPPPGRRCSRSSRSGCERIRLVVRGDGPPRDAAAGRARGHRGRRRAPGVLGRRATTAGSSSAPCRPRPARRPRGRIGDQAAPRHPDGRGLRGLADAARAAAAAAVGMDVVSGLDMLVYQAAEQFRLFTGEQPPVQAMYAAGRQALGR